MSVMILDEQAQRERTADAGALINEQDYPLLAVLADPLLPPVRPILGRDKEVQQLLAAMLRPELCNALLLGPPGSGKTALVQATSAMDTERLYLEVDAARMIAHAGTPELMAAHMKAVADQAERFVADTGRELVLFIDEFHQLVQLSAAVVEAIKPILAASGTRGLRLIVATTNEEYHQHVASNQALTERLQRVNLSPPDKAMTVAILRGMAQRYQVAEHFSDDRLFERIVDYTERYMPASSQPRKSILVLDSLIGWNRLTRRPMDVSLLGEVMNTMLGVNVDFRVDGAAIKTALDAKVLSQDLATSAVAKRLQLSVAGLNDPTKPESSMLFTGSTGVGKTALARQLAALLFGDDQRHLIRFDMTEFAQDSSVNLFRSELTRRVWDLSHAVVLFDEIEKASPMVTRLLLQVLDDGRLTDDHGRQVSFLNTHIVLTTNAGSEVFESVGQYVVDDTGSGENLKHYAKLIRRSITNTTEGNRFPVELLGRIDVIVPFQPLSTQTQQQIVLNKLQELIERVWTLHGVYLDIKDPVLAYLIHEVGTVEASHGGARAAVARLTDEVTAPVAKFLNEHPGHPEVVVDVAGEMAHTNKQALHSHASVVVSLPRNV